MSWTPPQGGAGPYGGSGLGRGESTGRASEWATISLALGILAIFFNLLAVPSILALVYANKAREQIAASGGTEQGAGRALARALGDRGRGRPGDGRPDRAHLRRTARGTGEGETAAETAPPSPGRT